MGQIFARYFPKMVVYIRQYLKLTPSPPKGWYLQEIIPHWSNLRQQGWKRVSKVPKMSDLFKSFLSNYCFIWSFGFLSICVLVFLSDLLSVYLSFYLIFCLSFCLLVCLRVLFTMQLNDLDQCLFSVLKFHP